jgi:hypothetical protein
MRGVIISYFTLPVVMSSLLANFLKSLDFELLI